MKNLFWKMFLVLLTVSLLMTACQAAVVEEPAPAEEAAAEEAAPAEEEAAPAEEEAAPAEEEAPAEEFVFGVLMVGPYNDHGWSEAHYNAGLYAEEHIPGAKMVYVDRVNPADRPGTTTEQLAEELVAQGAQFIIFNSDDMKDGATIFAGQNPDIPVMHISGDIAWADGQNYQEIPNLANYMPQMEYVEMVAGCAAAVTTQTGKIGFVGPLINDETRRYVNTFYLGARHCWTEYLGNDAADLEMKVNWIGFWFNIPGVTADPTQVADEFLNSGYDVIASGLDTMEPLVQTSAAAAAGKEVWAVAYDYVHACDEAPEICLGVRYFNWGPAYVRFIQAVQSGTYESTWEFDPPVWEELNNLDVSPVGFLKGDALTEENAALVDQFIAELGGGLNLLTGPLNWQDGTTFLAEGETATTPQLWYEPQLLEGVEGLSVPE